MDALAIIAIVLAVIGIIGGIVPMLPGPPISWCALLCMYLSSSPDEPITLTALIIWLIATVVITVLDYIMPGITSRWFGGHKAAERGALIGMIAGMFLTPIGMVLGSFLGAFFGEYITQNKNAGASLKAAVGAFSAFILTTGAKVIFSTIILWQVIAAL